MALVLRLHEPSEVFVQQQATVQWKDSIKKGSGEISTGSGAIKDLGYSYATRFEGQRGTNPEELIGAAHAACFTMAMSAELTKKGFEIKNLETKALIFAEKVKDELTVTSSQLVLVADVPGLSEGELRSIADHVKVTCPISRALNLEITVEARLKNESREIFLEQMI